MNALQRAKNELAVANRILAHLGIVDEDGHISLRHPADPEKFLLARALSPSLVEPSDILEFNADGAPVAGKRNEVHAERFVHAAVLAARPDINAVLYARSEDVLPFSVTGTPMPPVIGPVGDMGTRVPVWDIARKFGANTDLAVTTLERGRDLARCLGSCRVCLIRGAGFISTGRSLNDVVRMSAYIPKSARALAASLAVGKVKPLSAGEVKARLAIDPESNAMRRGWEYWAASAGCAEWLRE